MELLADAGVELEGAEAVVVGRSNLFGKPMAQLLLAENATVTDLPLAHARPARGVRPRGHPDRGGRPSAADRGATSSSPGAVVIDVGMNRLTPEEAGNKSGLVGDVDFSRRRRGRLARSRPCPAGSGR